MIGWKNVIHKFRLSLYICILDILPVVFVTAILVEHSMQTATLFLLYYFVKQFVPSFLLRHYITWSMKCIIVSVIAWIKSQKSPVCVLALFFFFILDRFL